MYEIKIPLRSADQTKPVMRILDRKNWFVSKWVHDTFGLYYALLDLDNIELIVNKNHTKKIKNSLNQKCEIHRTTDVFINSMKSELIASDQRYCDWHEVFTAPESEFDTEWADTVSLYQSSVDKMHNMTSKNYDVEQVYKTEDKLAQLVCKSSVKGFGSELYETLCMIDSLRNGSLQSVYYKMMLSK